MSNRIPRGRGGRGNIRGIRGGICSDIRRGLGNVRDWSSRLGGADSRVSTINQQIIIDVTGVGQIQGLTRDDVEILAIICQASPCRMGHGGNVNANVHGIRDWLCITPTHGVGAGAKADSQWGRPGGEWWPRQKRIAWAGSMCIGGCTAWVLTFWPTLASGGGRPGK